MKTTIFKLAAVSMLAAATGSVAHATTLDFDTLPSGTVATDAYAADGVSIDAGLTYLAEANISLVTGLNNDICGQGPACYNSGYYPTQDTLVFGFAAPASGISFTFNNYGDNGTTSYTAYGTSGIIDSGVISSLQGALVTVSGSGITNLTIDNGGSPWIYGVDNLSFTPGAAAVPEPATWALMLAGFGLVGYAMRKRATVRASYNFA